MSETGGSKEIRVPPRSAAAIKGVELAEPTSPRKALIRKLTSAISGLLPRDERVSADEITLPKLAEAVSNLSRVVDNPFTSVSIAPELGQHKNPDPEAFEAIQIGMRRLTELGATDQRASEKREGKDQIVEYRAKDRDILERIARGELPRPPNQS